MPGKSEFESYALGLQLSHRALLRNLDRFIEIAAQRRVEPIEDFAAFVALYGAFLDLHHRGEDDHLFPALRRHSAGRTTDAAHLDRLSREHRDIDHLGVRLGEIARSLNGQAGTFDELGRTSRDLKALLEPHTSAEEDLLSARHLPEMISEQELRTTTQDVGRANRSRALAMASFLASSLEPSEQRALLGDAPWVFRKLLGVVGGRRMRRFRPFVQTTSIAL